MTKPLSHESHTYTPSPDSRFCVCGLWASHHVHAGVSTADCTCMECTVGREGAVAAWGLTNPTLRDLLRDALNADPHFTTKELLATVMRVLAEQGIDGGRSAADLRRAGQAEAARGQEARSHAADVARWEQTADGWRDSSRRWQRRAEQAERQSAEMLADVERLEAAVGRAISACQVALIPPASAEAVRLASSVLAMLEPPEATDGR